MEVQTKDELLEQISLAVEQIQKQFVQGGNVIKDCQETFFLCQCVDNILHHGLKEGLISWAMESTVWPLLEKITCSEDIEEIKMLRLKTTRDKCQAWIKMAVNENLLGSYIAAINQDHSLLIHHYYEYAFLRDPVMTDTVKSILNYGIANFDFEISISYNQPSSKFDARSKQDQPCDYDAVEQTAPKENGLEPSNIETEIATTADTLSKRRRKKKVKTVVIEDQDDRDDFEETKEKVEVEEENLEESKVDGRKDKITFKNGGNDMQFSTETSSTTTDQSDNSETSDVRTNRLTCSVNGHVIEAASDSVVRDADDGLQDSTSERTDFVSAQLDQYLTFNSRENRDDDRRKNKERDTLGRQIERASPIQEFSANDFLLDETEPQSTLNDNKEVLLGGASNTTDCSNEPENATKGDSGANRKKSENLSESLEIEAELTVTNKKITNISSISENKHSGSPSESSINNKDGERLSEALTKTERSSNSQRFKSQESIGSTKEENVSNDEFSEVLSRSYSYDYRVRRIENVDFVSSSYGSSSALSDLTDDDRDLNFIPGIHRMSSKSFTSSFEKKSAADSSVSFDENGFPLFESSHYTDSLTSQHSSTDDNSRSFSDLSNEWDLFEDLLNVEEEHFSKPDNFAGLTTTEELEIAIEHYKKLIKTRRNKSQQRDDLVKKLVKLRLRLQQENEGPPEENPQCRKILSHQFSKKEGKKEGTKYFCDQCGKNIWTIWQTLYTCNDCGYYSHRKCLEHIQRPCPKRNLSTVSYIMEICPDTGLDAQQYRCAECRKEIAFSKKLVAEGRICDYTGQYFCDNCHWNDQVTIPARVLRNWDFSQRKVCRKTKQLLELMKARPILNIQEINPMLYRYVEELREVGKLREDILIMKKYFLTCREALESKLLIQLQKRQHFVDSAHTYSFQDLLDLNNDVLLPEVSKVHSLFLAHIKADCELCRARGFICEMCQDSSDIIFAFDPHAVKCTNCSAVFHKVCFKPDDCPKCQRRKKVAEEQE